MLCGSLFQAASQDNVCFSNLVWKLSTQEKSVVFRVKHARQVTVKFTGPSDNRAAAFNIHGSL